LNFNKKKKKKSKKNLQKKDEKMKEKRGFRANWKVLNKVILKNR